MPGSSTTPVVRALALAHADVWPSATQTASAHGTRFLSRLNGWPACTPADASPTSSRMPAHGLGPMWFAIPSSQGTCTPYSLPVSRRTCVKTRLRSVFGSIKTPPDLKIIAYSAFYEVVVDDTSFRAEFLHSLGQKRPLAGGAPFPLLAYDGCYFSPTR